ncbi:hypothetical protein ACH4E8_13750 [Streptomyces sp. NPDC017979]|uniref:hypothetical protein n=1 Tax=Streptomyces sp. NPDC017979 TaxID=3365024 RepID=UPI00379B0FA7
MPRPSELTPDEARNLLVTYFAEHPPPIAGELHIAPEWYEDATDYLPAWGAREFFVDGQAAYGRVDNTAIFIDKRTGAVRADLFTPNFDKIRAMTPVIVPEAARHSPGPDEARLVEVGRALFARFADAPVLDVVELPDGLGVCLVHAVRGGGKIYVAPDETTLFVGSAVSFDAGLQAFRDGARSPGSGG